jgi:NADP-dependent 3-hydroxy acid dehydrogenase YdfG
MRIFVAGASGALGSRLVPQLIDAGHDVIGTHNSPASAELLRTLGAKPVLLDLLDARAVFTTPSITTATSAPRTAGSSRSASTRSDTSTPLRWQARRRRAVAALERIVRADMPRLALP